MDLIEGLRPVLVQRKRLELRDENAVRCAVLVPLIPDGDGYRVVYTVRTDHLPDHRGQVAFPGGKYTPSDATLAETALREAAEEVGIHPPSVDVLGCLDDVVTLATRYVVTPVVGVLPHGTHFRLNPAEVADFFTVPVGHLCNPHHHGTVARTWADEVFQVDVINAGAHEIWGLTLTITKNLLDCIEQACAHSS